MQTIQLFRKKIVVDPLLNNVAHGRIEPLGLNFIE